MTQAESCSYYLPLDLRKGLSISTSAQEFPENFCEWEADAAKA